MSAVAQFQLAGERFVADFRDWMETIDWSGTAKPSKGMPNPRNPKRIQPKERPNRLLRFRKSMLRAFEAAEASAENESCSQEGNSNAGRSRGTDQASEPVADQQAVEPAADQREDDHARPLARRLLHSLLPVLCRRI